MFKQKKVLTVIFSILLIAGLWTSVVRAEDEFNNGLPEVLTGMDENGDVYELDTSSGYVDVPMVMSLSDDVKVVNFNTKGFSAITEYTEVGTDIGGYTCGAYGADAAYLGTFGTKVRFMLSGVIGEVEASEVQVVDFSNVNILSHYIISDGRLYHKIATNLTSNSYGSTLEQGAAPSYMKSGIKYYSYDGHYFYTDYEVMLSDYGNNTRNNSVNAQSPYFNYFQYLPFRSQSNYSSSDLNNIINNKVDSQSKMRNLGGTFVNYQNMYGVNALLTIGVAANESAWGMSNISQTKNNLFGLNAVDSNPNEAANYYSDVTLCVKDFMETYLSKQYLNPNNWKYYGGFLGNKASGANVKYASDPYWGEKAANVAWVLDKANGNKDTNAYSIGIKDTISSDHTALNVRKESNVSSTKLYNTGKQSFHAFLIISEENEFYKIQSDGVLNSDRSAIDNSSGVYRFSTMYAYASKDYITKVSSGNKVSDNNVNVEWSATGIKTDVRSPQLLSSKINLTAEVNNTSIALEYKFVWMKNNWETWGVIRDFSSNNAVIWSPSEGGDYKLYMNVRDTLGRSETVVIDYTIKNWGMAGISTDLKSPQAKNTTINITPEIIGSTDGLVYKFVWEKDNWNTWNVIRDFSNKKTAAWIPDDIGDYTLYVDVKDSTGFRITKTMSFTIEDKIWILDSIQVDKPKQMQLGEELTICTNVKNSNSALQYKYVWMRDNWDEWGVIRDFSIDNTVKWTPKELGEYYLYVDVKDSQGNMESLRINYKIVQGEWKIDEIRFTPEGFQTVKNNVEIKTTIEGNTTGLKYKFVWMRDNWKQWGIIKDFSSANYVNWYPNGSGEYKIYVDVKDLSGNLKTNICDYEVLDKDWKFERIELDQNSPKEIGTQVTILPVILGNNTNLEYKYVWMKDDWSSWGVIQEFSNNSSCKWIPQEAGEYKLYVDVRRKGVIGTETKVIPFTINWGTWEIAGVNFDLISPQIPNAKIEIASRIIGNKTGLEYKFVWMKENWSSWGIIQNRSQSAKATWVPDEVGEYSIYIDVFDKSGKSATYVQTYVIDEWIIVTKPLLQGSAEDGITVSVEGINHNKDIEYKFVWMKDNWSSWGVIQEFSEDQIAKWVPSESGDYYLYVDVKNNTKNTVETKRITYKVY